MPRAGTLALVGVKFSTAKLIIFRDNQARRAAFFHRGTQKAAKKLAPP